MIEQRLRLKAASCRLFIKKRTAVLESDAEYEIRQQMNEMIAQAKAMPSCFLWVFWRERSQPDDAALDRIADNYVVHADAVELMRRVDKLERDDRLDDEVDAFHVLAEANSALRVAMADTWLKDDDHDQSQAHVWLRQETASRRVFIGRHMTAGDPADPSNAADLRVRIKAIGKRIDDRSGRVKGVRDTLRKIEYHAGQIVKNGAADAPAHWAKISEAVGRLAGMGIMASDPRVSEAVGSHAAALWPSEATETLEAHILWAVIARAKALEAGHGALSNQTRPTAAREWSESVLELRPLLHGKRLVIIGGERNRDAVERLIEAFELVDAEWVPLTEHGSGSPMRTSIFRPDTAIVLVIVKLTGHLHADEAREHANSAGKPCVYLTGGYNPEQVAQAITNQASTRLRQ